MAALLRQLTASHDARQVALHIERFQRAELNYVGRFVVAENFGEAAVDAQRLAVPFDAAAGQGGFDQRSEPLLADAEFLFGLFYGADIDLYGDEVGDFAVASLDRRNRRAAPVQRAVLPPIAEFAVPILAAPNGGPELAVVAFGSSPRLEDAGRLAGDLVELVAGHFGERRIDVLDSPRCVGDDDDRRTVLDRAPKATKPDRHASRFGIALDADESWCVHECAAACPSERGSAAVARLPLMRHLVTNTYILAETIDDLLAGR